MIYINLFLCRALPQTTEHKQTVVHQRRDTWWTSPLHHKRRPDPKPDKRGDSATDLHKYMKIPINKKQWKKRKIRRSYSQFVNWKSSSGTEVERYQRCKNNCFLSKWTSKNKPKAFRRKIFKKTSKNITRLFKHIYRHWVLCKMEPNESRLTGF